MTEEWRPVPGYSGYEVSDDGQIRSYRIRGAKGRESDTPHPLAQRLNAGGYPRVTMHRDGKAISRPVHQLVAVAFLGECPVGREVRHLDGDRLNPRVSNLVYGTRAENIRDAVRHGTHNMTRKTHCPQNHPYDEGNTIRRTNGSRDCRACRRLAA